MIPLRTSPLPLSQCIWSFASPHQHRGENHLKSIQFKKIRWTFGQSSSIDNRCCFLGDWIIYIWWWWCSVVGIYHEMKYEMYTIINLNALRVITKREEKKCNCGRLHLPLDKFKKHQLDLNFINYYVISDLVRFGNVTFTEASDPRSNRMLVVSRVLSVNFCTSRTPTLWKTCWKHIVFGHHVSNRIIWSRPRGENIPIICIKL